MPRDHVLGVPLTPGEHARLVGRARVADLPLSSYLRQAALAHRVRSSAERITPGDVDEFVEMGHRLNDIAHTANTTGRLVAEEALSRELTELRAVLSRLSDRLAT